MNVILQNIAQDILRYFYLLGISYVKQQTFIRNLTVKITTVLNYSVKEKLILLVLAAP